MRVRVHAAAGAQRGARHDARQHAEQAVCQRGGGDRPRQPEVRVGRVGGRGDVQPALQGAGEGPRAPDRVRGGKEAGNWGPGEEEGRRRGGGGAGGGFRGGASTCVHGCGGAEGGARASLQACCRAGGTRR